MRLRTKTGYKLLVDVVSPLILAELRERHGVNNPKPFTYKHKVKETGAELTFEYELPETPPSEADDPEGFTRYHECLAYMREFNEKYAEYRKARNRLVLARAIRVISGPGSVKWKATMKSGKWRRDLKAADIEVTEADEFPLFLKAVVLKHEEDYFKVLDVAIPEEVTLPDVQAAFDRFRALLRRVTTLAGDDASTAGEVADLLAAMGISDATDDVNGGDVVVSPIEDVESESSGGSNGPTVS